MAGNTTAFGGDLSSPELTSSSNGSSPESSGGASTAPAPASAPAPAKSAPNKQLKASAPVGPDKRKQDDNNKTTAHKDRRASGGESGAPGHTHDQLGSDEDGQFKPSQRADMVAGTSDIGHASTDLGSDWVWSDVEGGASKGKTSERRRQQNRQAQRAFRERKEKVRAWIGFNDGGLNWELMIGSGTAAFERVGGSSVQFGAAVAGSVD